MSARAGTTLLAIKPHLRIGQIWNMCFGFLGVQIGFGLQNANASRIFQTLGANVDDLPILWIAAPVTGLLIQPLVGHFSDRTWGRLGRRRPYFLFGALATAAALFAMPAAPVLWIAAALLWLMDGSINVTMEPFRAFVGDLLPDRQRTTGFAMQSFFIGIGAVFASALPWLLTNILGIANTAPPGVVPPSVHAAFTIGGAALLAAVLWTVFTTREYSPDQVRAFAADHPGTVRANATPPRSAQAYRRGGTLWLLAGALAIAITAVLRLEKELYVLGGVLVLFGLAQVFAAWRRADGAAAAGGFAEILDDLFAMPHTMRRLAVVQFFAWFGLFAMWIFTTAAVTSYHFGVSDPASAAYNRGADLVGLLFGMYNGVAAIAAFAIPVLAARIGRRATHMINLALGGLGLFGFLLIRDPDWLWLPMVGIGIAWASILSVPYAILSGALPQHKLGVYMGIFNIFIVLPQLLAATILGLLLRHVFGGAPIYALALGGASLLAAVVAMLAVSDAPELQAELPEDLPEELRPGPPAG
jgi:maltose/moltooligosaccharide transporter